MEATDPCRSSLLVIALLALSSGVFWNGCARSSEYEESIVPLGSAEEIVTVLSERELTAVTKSWRLSKTQPLEEEAKIVFLRVPQSTDIVSDGPRYFLYGDSRTNHFWIMVSSGLVGQTEWRGPVSLKKDGNIVPHWQD